MNPIPLFDRERPPRFHINSRNRPLVTHFLVPVEVPKGSPALFRRQMMPAPGSTVRDSRGQSYIVWHDGSLRRTKTLLQEQLSRLNPEAQVKVAQAIASATLETQDATTV
jgi:hypothetical protein